MFRCLRVKEWGWNPRPPPPVPVHQKKAGLNRVKVVYITRRVFHVSNIVDDVEKYFRLEEIVILAVFASSRSQGIYGGLELYNNVCCGFLTMF